MMTNDSIKEIEKKWRARCPQFTLSFLREAFPEAKRCVLPEKLKALKNERKEVIHEIKEKLRKSKQYDAGTQVFIRALIEHFEAPRLVEIERQMSFMKMLMKGPDESSVKGELEVDEARSRSIVEIAQINNLKTKQLGRYSKTSCPFHEDRTPSCVFYPATNSFYCFGCQKGGDVITFVRELHNLTFPDSIAYLLTY